jgi:ribosomal protein S3AE
MTDEAKNRISQELRRIYPLRYFEIRKVEVLR